jgi:hypothetical protein
MTYPPDSSTATSETVIPYVPVSGSVSSNTAEQMAGRLKDIETDAEPIGHDGTGGIAQLKARVEPRRRREEPEPDAIPRGAVKRVPVGIAGGLEPPARGVLAVLDERAFRNGLPTRAADERAVGLLHLDRHALRIGERREPLVAHAEVDVQRTELDGPAAT